VRWLTVKPWRGAQVAAGAVVLVVAVGLLGQEPWSDAGHLAVLAPALALLAVLAARAPLAEDGVHPWHAALYVAVWVVALLTGDRLLGLAGQPGVLEDPQADAVLFAVLAAVALPFARRGAPAMTLLGAGSATLAAVRLLADGGGPDRTRWLLLAAAVVLTLAAVARRDRSPEHARALAGVGGAAVLGIALSGVPAAALAGLGEPGGLGTWWQAVLLVGGFGQVAYGCVDRARVSVALGAAALGAFVLLAGAGSWGWTVLLVLVAGAFLAVGLRPSRPLPPPPEEAAAPPPPLPFARR
jgi:hypothetical protein